MGVWLAYVIQTLVIAGGMKHTRHKFVALDMIVGSGTHEDIGLVQEKHRVPKLAQRECSVEVLRNLSRLRSKHACTHRVQRDIGLLGDCFCSERLANTRRPKHQENQPTALCPNQYVDILVLYRENGE